MRRYSKRRWRYEDISLCIPDGDRAFVGISGEFCPEPLSTVFPIIIQTFLWNYLYGHGDAGAMTGYSYPQIMVYTLLAGMVSKLVYTGFEYAVNQDIKTGGLNKYLVRPVDYFAYRFFDHMGEKACRWGF